MVAVTSLDWLSNPVRDDEDGLKNVVLCGCFHIVHLVDRTCLNDEKKKLQKRFVAISLDTFQFPKTRSCASLCSTSVISSCSLTVTANPIRYSVEVHKCFPIGILGSRVLIGFAEGEPQKLRTHCRKHGKDVLAAVCTLVRPC